MVYKSKNGLYTVVGKDNCEWSDQHGGWAVTNQKICGSVVLERMEDGRIFFLFYDCDKEKWVGRGIKDGKIDGNKEVTL